jgi:hypothetical protein
MQQESRLYEFPPELCVLLNDSKGKRFVLSARYAKTAFNQVSETLCFEI